MSREAAKATALVRADRAGGLPLGGGIGLDTDGPLYPRVILENRK